MKRALLIAGSIAALFTTAMSFAGSSRSRLNDGANSPMTGWNPFVFAVSEAPGREALAQLAEQHDTALADAIARNPNFAREFPGKLAEFASIALNSIPAPRALLEDYESDYEFRETHKMESGPSYAFGKALKNFGIFAMRNAVHAAAPSLSGSEGYENAPALPYRYCESLPGSTSPYCQRAAPYDLGWSIARRIISSSRFVRAACPAVSAYMKWDLQWKLGTAQEARRFAVFANEFERMLEFVRGDGSWSTSRLESFQTNFDPSFYKVLVRRYLDGGPEMIDAISECWESIRGDNQFDWGDGNNEDRHRPFAFLIADPRAPAAIDSILQFRQAAPANGIASLEIASAPLAEETIYRLTHRLDATTPLPARYIPPVEAPPWHEGDNDDGIYLQTLIGYGYWTDSSFYVAYDAFARLLAQLTALDPNHAYRSINRAEHARLLAAGEISTDPKSKTCIVEGANFLEQKTGYYIYGDGRVEEAEGAEFSGCQPGDFKILRDAKPIAP